jgi:signal peptide peptidase SppA
MNIQTVKQSLSNGIWALSPNDFLSLKSRIDGMKADLTIIPITNNDGNTPDDNGRVVVNIVGELFRGTGLDSDTCDCIGITELDNLDAELISVRDNDAVKTIILKIESPGGTVHSHATAVLINEIAQTKNVIGYVSTMACSAAYELAAQCTELYLSDTAWVGFVGTIFVRADYTQANSGSGVGYTFITSSPKKLWLNPNTQITKNEQAWIESVVAYSYDMFKSSVLSNRTIDEQYLDSSIFIGSQAVKLNFADGVLNNFGELLKITETKQ